MIGDEVPTGQAGCLSLSRTHWNSIFFVEMVSFLLGMQWIIDEVIVAGVLIEAAFKTWLQFWWGSQPTVLGQFCNITIKKKNSYFTEDKCY